MGFLVDIINRVFSSSRPHPIRVQDRVQIVNVNAEHNFLLNRSGQVIMIVDEVDCLVQLDDGETAEIDIKYLKKV